MKKNNRKIIIGAVVCAFLIILAIGIFFIIKGNNSEMQPIIISEDEVKYFKVINDNKIGVIDKDGNIIIEPQYLDIQIPNPTTDLFICTSDTNPNNRKWKAVDSQNQPKLQEYEEIEAISINQLTSDIPYEKTVLKFKKGNYYGLIDFTGKKILPAEYEEITNLNYKEGYLKVKKEGLIGIVDINGQTIIKPIYNDIASDGFYNEKTKYSKAGFIIQVKSDNGYRYGYANTKGKIFVEPSVNELSRINDLEDEKVTYLITSSNGKYGLIKDDKQLLENEYESIEYDKTTNLLVVTKGGKQGVTNLEGQQVIDLSYDSIIIGGDYINATLGNDRTVFDKNGKKIDTKLYSHMPSTNNHSVVIDENNNYNIVDSANNLLLSDKYIYIEHYKEDLYIATQGTNSGIINTNGNIVVPIKYSTIQKINGTDLLEATMTANNQIDLINVSGNVSTGLENSLLEKNDKYIKIYSENDAKYFDFSGNEKSYKDFYPNNKIYADKKNGKWGFVDANGNKVVDYVYDMVTEQNGNFAGVKWNGKWGVIDTEGKGILNPTYKLTWNNAKFLSVYYAINNTLGETIYSSEIQKED